MKVLMFSVHSGFDFRYAEQRGLISDMLDEIERCRDRVEHGVYGSRAVSLQEFQDLCNDEEIDLKDWFIYFYEEVL